MDNQDENLHEKNFSLWLLSILEDYAVQKLRLKTFILSLPMAEEPGFSLDDILHRTSLSPDSERDLRARYVEARARLLSIADYQSASRQAQQSIEESKRWS